MIKRSSAPTAMFWNFVGVAIVILSVSMFRATNFKLEAANQKLEVNRTLENAKKTVTTIKSDRLPPSDKQKLELAKEQIEAQQQEILGDEDYTEDSQGSI